jgi:hypothetical protein
MQKLDLKKQFKQLYAPRPGRMEFVDVPTLSYLMVDGHGDPNTSKEYSDAVEALFSLAYTLKFSLKKSPAPVDWGVMPLEGLWWADDPQVFHTTDKSTWQWTAMILQPEVVDRTKFEAAVVEVRRKKNPPALDRVRLATLEEEKAVQVLYTGPYADEGPVIQQMHHTIHAKGHELAGKHHEIYLSDPRRTAPEKLKTIIRQPYN